MCNCSELYRGIAIEAIFQLTVGGWSPKIQAVIEANGTRSRWWHMFGDEIETVLIRLADPVRFNAQ